MGWRARGRDGDMGCRGLNCRPGCGGRRLRWPGGGGATSDRDHCAWTAVQRWPRRPKSVQDLLRAETGPQSSCGANGGKPSVRALLPPSLQ